MEKIMNIDRNFEEVGFNWRPLFNEIMEGEEAEEYKAYNYYLNRTRPQRDDVLKRLKMVYQDYKTDYYLYKKRSFQEFYETMFDVDGDNFYYNSHSFTFLHWSIIE